MNNIEMEKLNLESSMLHKEKNIFFSYALWFFLGLFGAHRFYLGKIGSGIAMLVLSIIGYVTAVFFVGFIFLLIVGVWWLIDAYLTYKITEEHNDEMRKLKLKFFEEKQAKNKEKDLIED